MKSFFLQYLRENTADQIKYAVVPGSFKPPHKGHLAMIQHYSVMVGNTGKVVVFISKPSAKSERKTAINTVISAETTKEILDLYCKNLPNVEIRVSESSPVKDAFTFGDEITNGILIFGCSKKGDDIKRWNNVKDYYAKNYPDIYVVDPQTTAVDITTGAIGAVSASDFRAAFPEEKDMVKFLPDELSKSEKIWVIKKLLS